SLRNVDGDQGAGCEGAAGKALGEHILAVDADLQHGAGSCHVLNEHAEPGRGLAFQMEPQGSPAQVGVVDGAHDVSGYFQRNGGGAVGVEDEIGLVGKAAPAQGGADQNVSL